MNSKTRSTRRSQTRNGCRRARENAEKRCLKIRRSGAPAIRQSIFGPKCSRKLRANRLWKWGVLQSSKPSSGVSGRRRSSRKQLTAQFVAWCAITGVRPTLSEGWSFPASVRPRIDKHQKASPVGAGRDQRSGLRDALSCATNRGRKAGSTRQRQSGSNECGCGLPSGSAAAGGDGSNDAGRRRGASPCGRLDEQPRRFVNPHSRPDDKARGVAAPRHGDFE